MGSGIDGSWALNRPDRQLNWGHRAIHVVTGAAKQIVSAAYRQAPRYSYFEGCSNGGRQAAMEAQRYPVTRAPRWTSAIGTTGPT